jgi:hypothetical protein
MMEAARTSETLVQLYQTTRCYNPEDSHLQTVHFFSAKADVIAIDEDSLFDEISSLKAFVMKEKIKEWDMKKANTCARWSEEFLHFY